MRRLVDFLCSDTCSVTTRSKMLYTVANATPLRAAWGRSNTFIYVSLLIGISGGAVRLSRREGEHGHEVFWSSSHVFNFGFGFCDWVGNFLQNL